MVLRHGLKNTAQTALRVGVRRFAGRLQPRPCSNRPRAVDVQGGALIPLQRDPVRRDGDSIIYTLRFEKTENRPGGGWFVKKELYGDDARPRRPDLVWTTPKDLTVIVHTKGITGRVLQNFTNPSGNDGSLTFEYRADGLEQ
jgi:hypothetical protein